MAVRDENRGELFKLAVQSSDPLAGQIGNGACKDWRRVEGFGAFEANAKFRCVFAKRNVHVVKNFDVVAEKADGLEQYRFDVIGSDGIECGLNRRTDPRATAGSLALE